MSLNKWTERLSHAVIECNSILVSAHADFVPYLSEPQDVAEMYDLLELYQIYFKLYELAYVTEEKLSKLTPSQSHPSNTQSEIITDLITETLEKEIIQLDENDPDQKELHQEFTNALKTYRARMM